MQFGVARALALRMASVALSSILVAPAAAQPGAPTAEVAVDLRAQPLADALAEIARRYGVPVRAATPLVAGRNAPAWAG